MNRQDKIKFMNELEEAGIAIYRGIPALGGFRTICFTPEDTLDYLENPIAFCANHYGLSVDEYREWMDSQGSVSCGGKTRAGKRCKFITDANLEPREWKKRQSKERFCHLHGPTAVAHKEAVR